MISIIPCTFSLNCRVWVPALLLATHWYRPRSLGLTDLTLNTCPFSRNSTWGSPLGDKTLREVVKSTHEHRSWMTGTCNCVSLTHSPSWLHSTVGSGWPLTLHCKSTSCPAMTALSCTPEVPEITGGAKRTHQDMNKWETKGICIKCYKIYTKTKPNI